MEYRRLVDYWIEQHNEKFPRYLFSDKEPRYDLKNFFLNSYYLFKTLGIEWDEYLESYDRLFRRDPSNDYYGNRNPFTPDKERLHALEWTSFFEIIANVGFPRNRSAKDKLLYRSTQYLKEAMKNPESPWVNFMLSSAIANLPENFNFIKDWLPSQISKYIQGGCSPHQYVAYLNALKNYENQDELKEEIIRKLLDWIKNPSGNPEAQIIIWARLITRLDWLPEINEDDIKSEICTNFNKALDEVYYVQWHYSPMILEAYYLCNSRNQQEISHQIATHVAPSSFYRLHDIFPFITPFDEALEVKEEVQTIKEKCNQHPTLAKCQECMSNKVDDCWIRVIAKITHTEPKLHSGYEVADVVIYGVRKGIYIVMKADAIKRQRGEGDVLYRQCVSLFSAPYALVLYLNPCETAPFVIEGIKKAAANSLNGPRFEVIDSKYVRQIYRKYKSGESRSLGGGSSLF